MLTIWQPGGKALPVVLTAGSGGSQSPLNATSLTVVQALGTIVPVLALSYQNLGIFVVDSVLTFVHPRYSLVLMVTQGTERHHCGR